MTDSSGPTQPLCDALRQTIMYRISDLEKELADKETRIRELEAFRWKIIGAAAIVGGVAGIGVNFLV